MRPRGLLTHEGSPSVRLHTKRQSNPRPPLILPNIRFMPGSRPTFSWPPDCDSIFSGIHFTSRTMAHIQIHAYGPDRRRADVVGMQKSIPGTTDSIIQKLLCRMLAVAISIAPFQTSHAGMIGTHQAASTSGAAESTRIGRNSIPGVVQPLWPRRLFIRVRR